MAECSYYRVDTKHLESREIRGDRQRGAPIVARSPWCAHKHSPVDREIATGTLGGGTKLECEGALAKCPLSDEQYDDA